MYSEIPSGGMKEYSAREPGGWRRGGQVGVFFHWQPLEVFGFSFPLCRIPCTQVQFSCSVMFSSLRLYGPQHTRPPCPSPLPEFTQTHIHRVGDAIHSSRPLSSPSPPAPIPPSIRVFFNESTLRMRWPKYWITNFLYNPDISCLSP